MTEAILQARVNQLLNAYLSHPCSITLQAYKDALFKLNALRQLDDKN